jgi:hypothetical protein
MTSSGNCLIRRWLVAARWLSVRPCLRVSVVDRSVLSVPSLINPPIRAYRSRNYWTTGDVTVTARSRLANATLPRMSAAMMRSV